jgi:23S rRNA (guanosine2251-2'-O)-methyltransferase
MELLYGRHAVLEALKAGRRRIYRVYLANRVQSAGIIEELKEAATSMGCPLVEAPREKLGLLAAVNHQGVLADADPFPYRDLEGVLPVDGQERSGRLQERGRSPVFAELFLVLDHLQDVQNVGTLLRTAEAMAVRAVLLPGRRSAGITPAVANASAGAVEHLDVALVGNLVQAIERLKRAGVWVVALDRGADAVDLGQADLSGPIALVVGAEGAGVSRLVREHCDWVLGIPMYGRVASLNAAVAGSIALVAARQSRERQGGAARGVA